MTAAQDPIQAKLDLAFAPLHKLALGIAVGMATGLLCFAITGVYLIGPRDSAFRLDLLGQYFYGFTPSWPGAFVALAWGSTVGFVAGWFVAFCRNLSMAGLLFITRTRAELAATRSFLDHI